VAGRFYQSGLLAVGGCSGDEAGLAPKPVDFGGRPGFARGVYPSLPLAGALLDSPHILAGLTQKLAHLFARVIDFGLGRALGSEHLVHRLSHLVGALLGNPDRHGGSLSTVTLRGGPGQAAGLGNQAITASGGPN